MTSPPEYEGVRRLAGGLVASSTFDGWHMRLAVLLPDDPARRFTPQEQQVLDERLSGARGVQSVFAAAWAVVVYLWSPAAALYVNDQILPVVREVYASGRIDGHNLAEIGRIHDGEWPQLVPLPMHRRSTVLAGPRPFDLVEVRIPERLLSHGIRGYAVLKGLTDTDRADLGAFDLSASATTIVADFAEPRLGLDVEDRLVDAADLLATLVHRRVPTELMVLPFFA